MPIPSSLPAGWGRTARGPGSSGGTAARAVPYRYASVLDGPEYVFYGSFHEVRPDELIVQTFTFEGVPDGVYLEKLRLEDIGGGRCRLTSTSLCGSFAERDGMISDMDVGVHEGYAKLDALLAGG